MYLHDHFCLCVVRSYTLTFMFVANLVKVKQLLNRSYALPSPSFIIPDGTFIIKTIELQGMKIKLLIWYITVCNSSLFASMALQLSFPSSLSSHFFPLSPSFLFFPSNFAPSSPFLPFLFSPHSSPSHTFSSLFFVTFLF